MTDVQRTTEQECRQVFNRRGFFGVLGAAGGGIMAAGTAMAAEPLSEGDSPSADRLAPFADGVSDASPAIAQTVADAKTTARFTNGAVTCGLPIIRIPKGKFKIGSTILLELLKGVTLRGEGMGSTVLYVSTGITLLDLHRVAQVRIEGMTLAASRGAANPGAVPWKDCLIEGSTGVLIRERADDIAQGASTTGITFDHVEWVGFHRGIRSQGNQMGDNVTFIDPKFRDNFIDFESENGQAINWRVLGGEVLSFVDGTEGDYNALLAGWSASSRPATAPTGQRRIPGDRTSPTQDITVRDGAMIRTVAGGGAHFMSTSVIVKKTRVLVGGLSTDYATATSQHGTDQNLATFVFDATSSEIRALTSETGDTYGYARNALLRYERPHPHATDKTNRVSAQWCQERIVAQHSPWNAVYLTNGVTVSMNGVRFASGVAPDARLVSLVTALASTASNQGRYHSTESPALTRTRTGRQPGTLGAAWTPPTLVDHDIEQATGQVGTSLTAPARVQDRTLIPGATRQRQIAVLAELDGTLVHGTTRRLQLPANVMVLRVSAIAFKAPATGTVTLQFRRSNGAVLSTLTVSSGKGTESIVDSGKKLNACRAPWHEVATHVADGVLDVIQITTATQATINTGVLGYVLIEHI